MLESAVEGHLVARVKKLGGFAFKFIVPGFFGVPDRICFLPFGILLLVECKRPKKGRIRATQTLMGGMLVKLGFEVHYTYTKGQVDELMDPIERRIYQKRYREKRKGTGLADQLLK